MAGKNCSWGVRSKCPENTTGKIYVSKTYNDANGKSRFTSIDATNTKGFTPLSPNDPDPVLKNLEYVVQTDGQITFFQKRPDGSRFRLGDSIQDIVDNRLVFPVGSVSGATGAKIMRSLNYNLTETAKKRNITAPGVAQRPPNSDPQGGNPEGGAEPEGNDTQSGAAEEDKQIPQGTPNGTINITEQDRVQFAPNGGLRYPSNLSAYQDRIEIFALALKERTGATTRPPDPAPASTTPAANSSGKAQPPSSQSSGSATSGGSQNSGTRPGTPTDGKSDSNAAEEDQPNLSFSFGKIKYEKIDNPVVIAIQAPISDQNSVEWSSGQVNALEAAAYDAAIKATSSNELGNVIKKISDTLYNVAGEQGQRIRRLISGEAAGISNILARTDNIVLNPNLELLFSGPQLRTFTLTFKMSARDDAEAKQIRKIINYFKYHMAVRDDDPGASASKGLFLRAPHTFEIRYKLGRLPAEGDNVNPREHPSISKIKKPCALTNMTVDYTPLGSYSTYEDGSMVAYIMNLQFQEMTPVYSSDYSEFAPEKNANASIGY